MRFFVAGYYEDSEYESGHFQSVVPTWRNPILNWILEDGGCDTGALLNLPYGE